MVALFSFPDMIFIWENHVWSGPFWLNMELSSSCVPESKAAAVSVILGVSHLAGTLPKPQLLVCLLGCFCKPPLNKQRVLSSLCIVLAWVHLNCSPELPGGDKEMILWLCCLHRIENGARGAWEWPVAYFLLLYGCSINARHVSKKSPEPGFTWEAIAAAHIRLFSLLPSFVVFRLRLWVHRRRCVRYFSFGSGNDQSKLLEKPVFVYSGFR